MAVLLEFANVLFRKSALEFHVRGGVDALSRLRLPNLAEDDYLVRVGFMSTSEAEALLSDIEVLGMPLAAMQENAVLLQWGILPYPAWLSVGVVDDRAACWLAGTPPGPLVLSEHTRTLLCPDLTEAGVLDAMSAIANVSRAGPDSNGAHALVTCTRGEAMVELRTLMTASRKLLVVLDRVLARRLQRVLDVALLDDLAERLRAMGAQSLDG